ncbi:unnamed protein product [Gadus morhua 'NCC']
MPQPSDNQPELSLAHWTSRHKLAAPTTVSSLFSAHDRLRRLSQVEAGGAQGARRLLTHILRLHPLPHACSAPRPLHYACTPVCLRPPLPVGAGVTFFRIRLGSADWACTSRPSRLPHIAGPISNTASRSRESCSALPKGPGYWSAIVSCWVPPSGSLVLLEAGQAAGSRVLLLASFFIPAPSSLRRRSLPAKAPPPRHDHPLGLWLFAWFT